MRHIATLLLLLVASPAIALSVEEFTLNGIDSNGTLVRYTPYVSESEGAHLRDADGAFLTISIDKFTDQQDRSVLTNCLWKVSSSQIVCGAKNQSDGQVIFEGQHVETTDGSDLIKHPLEARQIQDKLRRMKSCTRPTAFLMCTNQCKPGVPRSLLLVYCGD